MSLWAMARVDLGLSSDEFWGLTPREFSFFAARYVERMKIMAACGMGSMLGGSVKQKPGNIVDFFDGK